MNASDMALLCVRHSYYALGMDKELSLSKQAHLNEMCNFISPDRGIDYQQIHQYYSYTINKFINIIHTVSTNS